MVSGPGVSRLLGVPKITSGTGEGQARAVVFALGQWGITDKISALCCDTTVPNTGIRDRRLLAHRAEDRATPPPLCMPTPCHGNVFPDTFKAFMKVYSASDVRLFRRFQIGWELIDTSMSGMADDVRPCISADSDSIIEFATCYLAANHRRDDYRGLLELTVLIYGAVPLRGVLFCTACTKQHARWM